MFKNTKKVPKVVLENKKEEWDELKESQLAKMKKYIPDYVPAIKFIEQNQLVYLFPIILTKLRLLWICEILGSFEKIWYFLNNY